MDTCPKCHADVVLTSTHNQRNGKWTILPLEISSGGDFIVAGTMVHETVDIMGESAGAYPVSWQVTSGDGTHRTHSPSHYLESENH